MINQTMMLPVGTTLQDGKYCVTRHMASGGFGNTYEVEHVKLGKHMALKEFFMQGVNLREGNNVTVSQPDNADAFDQMRTKFFNEAKRIARLEEPHIVEVSDFFEENRTAYYVMKLVDGESLKERMKRTGQPLKEQTVREVLDQMLQALDYVHQHDLLHLDLKPDNIMVDRSGHYYLIDFGASHQFTSTERQTLSTSTGLCYTMGYAPEEQVAGSTDFFGAWTDFYALGATLYSLLTNTAPPEVTSVKYKREQAFLFPSTVSADMRRLILWLMQSDYDRRPQTVAEIRQRLINPAGQNETRPINHRPSVDNRTCLHSEGSHRNYPPYRKPASSSAIDDIQKEISSQGKKLMGLISDTLGTNNGPQPRRNLRQTPRPQPVHRPESARTPEPMPVPDPVPEPVPEPQPLNKASYPQPDVNRPKNKPYSEGKVYYKGRWLDPAVARIAKQQDQKNLIIWGIIGAFFVIWLFFVMICAAAGA